MSPIGPEPAAGDEPWWHRSVVYQVYPRSFADADGDGVGDLRGIIERLDHIRDLGADVLWLSPVYRSPMVDNGYDISDYQDIDPSFGTLADLDELIAALHARGMKLVMDLVVNHTSDRHPWFLESRSSRDSPKRDWYYWRTPRPNPDAGDASQPEFHPPNNWTSVFLGPAWTYDVPTGEHYLHLFAPEQPDLNWENPQVRAAVYAMMRWWLDRGVDGFRMDVINLISKPAGLPDAPGGRYADGNQFDLVVNGPRLHEWLAEMHREVFARYPRTFLTVGEMPGVTTEHALLATDPARAELDMVFQFEHVGLDHGPLGKLSPQPLHLPDLKQNLARWQREVGDRGGWNSLYWDNHDQPRVVSRWGDAVGHWRDSATALAGVLHLHPGTPYVYQGEELGMTNAGFTTIEQYRDVEALTAWRLAGEMGLPGEAVLDALARMGRDNARTPVQWDASAHAGFTTGTPWLPVNPNHAWLNAAAQADDPDSVLAFYRRLIALRRSEDVVVSGDFTLLEPEHERLWAFERRLGQTRLLVLANLSGQPLDLPGGAPFDAAAGGRLLIGNLPEGAVGELRPWELRALLI